LRRASAGNHSIVALSDYERRVLEEIETELSCIVPSPRRRRIRLGAVVLASLLVLAGIAAVAALFLPPSATAAACTAVGLAVGIGFAFDWQRHRSF
jgi:hypothetical protein